MDGMLKKLDKHFGFIAGEPFRKFDEDMRQEFGGVGMYVETNPKKQTFIRACPHPGYAGVCRRYTNW